MYYAILLSIKIKYFCYPAQVTHLYRGGRVISTLEDARLTQSIVA